MSIARCTLAAALAVTLPASAATYGLVADWNGGPNPNGAWSFLSGNTLMPYWASMPPLSGSPGYAPSPNNGAFLPVFWQPGGSGTDVAVHSYDGFNGGGASGEAVLRWTSPINGTLDISGYFYYGQLPLQRSNDVTIMLGANTLLATTTSFAQHQDYANRYSFALNDLPVTAGQTLNISFVRSPGIAPGTVTMMDINLVAVPVPEPSTYALMLGGLAIVGGLAARRRLS